MSVYAALVGYTQKSYTFRAEGGLQVLITSSEADLKNILDTKSSKIYPTTIYEQGQIGYPRDFDSLFSNDSFPGFSAGRIYSPKYISLTPNMPDTLRVCNEIRNKRTTLESIVNHLPRK